MKAEVQLNTNSKEIDNSKVPLTERNVVSKGVLGHEHRLQWMFQKRK
jgi:hypothetical protein